MRTDKGYVLIILMMVVLVLAIGLTVAIPVYQTELQREKEAELIFRGRQYVEAVRLFQMKTPGRFPSSLRELEEKKFIRRLYKDPMTDKRRVECGPSFGRTGPGRERERPEWSWSLRKARSPRFRTP